MEFKEEELKQVLSDVFNISRDSVGEDTSIDTVEMWDSLKHLELVLALEQKFNVTFTHEETTEILNYNLIRMILEKHGVKLKQNELDQAR
mgnify:FL=1